MTASTFRACWDTPNGLIYDVSLNRGRLIGTDGIPRAVTPESSRGICFYALADRMLPTTSPVRSNPFYSKLSTLMGRITALEEPVFRGLFVTKHQEDYKGVNKEWAERLIELQENPQMRSTQSPEDLEQLTNEYPLSHLRAFIASGFPSFFDYLQATYFGQKRDAYRAFFAGDQSPEAITAATLAKTDAPEAVKRLQTLAQTAVATVFNLTSSSWRPEQPIDDLIKALRERGPLLVGGKFGNSYYKQGSLVPSVENFSSSELQVWRWLPNGRRTDIDPTRSHVVMVIGAAKVEDKEFVYFIDPNDGGDPTAAQKVYEIAYQNLKDYNEQMLIARAHAYQIA